MLRTEIENKIAAAVSKLIASGDLPAAASSVPIEVSDAKSAEHGDFACNFALAASKIVGKNPREIGEALKFALSGDSDLDLVEVAGPGFLNLRLKPETLARYVDDILGLGAKLAGQVDVEPLRINVEFVSVNPNGPITVGSGRGAAYGDTLCRVLTAVGHSVNREYYINDGTNSEQMRLFAESVMAHLEDRPLPDNGYKGDYVSQVAAGIKTTKQLDLGQVQLQSQDLMIERQRTDLISFGVGFDTWFSEQSLHDSGEVAKRLGELQAKGATDEEPHRIKLKMGKGAQIEEIVHETQTRDEDETPEGSGTTLWLRSTKFGDDMDRVLRRKDGRLTYIASDLAYHKDKFNRPPNADKLITVLGPDHHGYIARLHAVLAALELESGTPVSGVGIAGVSPESKPLSEIEAKIYRSPQERDACHRALEKARKELEVIIFQIVRFVKDGKPAPMRKRDGNIYELRDLIRELGHAQAPDAPQEEQERIGADVARFFYLMRSHDSHMDFDIDLATKQSDENPVFYVQYAHARICSVIAKAQESIPDWKPGDKPTEAQLSELTHERELALIKKILELPEIVARCASDYGVHRLTTYAVELARSYHHFYDACRVIQPDQPNLSRARLALCEAARIGLSASLNLLGVSAPERMERTVPAA